jgi:superfamily II RNA helicase
MVKICKQSYPKHSDEKYQSHFQLFPFPLSDFQKYAIEAIVEEQHILITAHTGSGKTLPAEFAIQHFTSLKKKIIYTSPIKALSNQKFYEFTNKYPGISFGILTGDIKFNPEADVIIMTTEILLNNLTNINNINNQNIVSSTSSSPESSSKSLIATQGSLDFQIDIQNDLGCVIFDEVHYINDLDRGKVWEECILTLPLHIQMVMLSATIDKPEIFAKWIEDREGMGSPLNLNNKPKKQVYLASTNIRQVPLTHYSFITCNSSIFKILKDKTKEEEIKQWTNKLQVIQTSGGKFQEEAWQKNKKMLQLFKSKNIYVKRQHVINQVSKYMVENEMLPALFFVFSRRSLEQMAQEVTTVLLEDDSKVPYIVRRECEQIIRKLPNYEEYLSLPEYNQMVSLLEKGIGIHHAGVIPIFREMVELLYAKGYIKILFATETFAVGINMPTKTTIFTDITKFDGSSPRILLSHEYTQMAGRAGRRGIDTVGNVIHLPNLFHNMEVSDHRIMMNGIPQSLISKFKITYSLLFNLISQGKNSLSDFGRFVKQSMVQNEILNESAEYYYKMSNITNEMDKLNLSINNMGIPLYIVQEYIDLQYQLPHTTNKKRKEISTQIENIQNKFKNLGYGRDMVSKYNQLRKELKEIEDNIGNNEKYIDNNIKITLNFLSTYNFIEKIDTIDTSDIRYKLSLRGIIASCMKEVPSLVFTEMILSNNTLESFTKLSSKQIVGIFSCFTNVSVNDDYKYFVPYTNDNQVKSNLTRMKIWIERYQKEELNWNITSSTEEDYKIHYDLIDYVMDWCDATDIIQCKHILQKMEKEKEIFLGEFVKALLKINNICVEMEKISELINNIELLHAIKQIPALTLKFVVTNQSLYV